MADHNLPIDEDKLERLLPATPITSGDLWHFSGHLDIDLSFLFIKECYWAYAELQSILVMQDCFAFLHDRFRFIFFQNWKSQKKLQSGGPGNSPGCCVSVFLSLLIS